MKNRRPLLAPIIFLALLAGSARASAPPAPSASAPPPTAEGRVKVRIYDWIDRDVTSTRRLLTDAEVMVSGGQGKIRIYHGEKQDRSRGFELRFLGLSEDAPTLALVNLSDQSPTNHAPVEITPDRSLIRVEPNGDGYGLISLTPAEAEAMSAPPGSYDLLISPDVRAF